MKNSKLLRKLLSAVCCMAMLVTMLPILPAAAADAGVFFEDDFSKHTMGAFDAASHGYKMTKASGAPVVNIAKDGSNQVMTITGARPYIEMGTPEGAFTVQFDFKRNASSSGLFELWMADLGDGKNIRFRIHDNGAFGFVDTATSKNYLVQNDGGFSNGGYNASRTESSNALLEANTWYRVEFVADPSANTLKIAARERDNASADVYQAERTMSDFSNHVLRMDGQDMTDSGSKINVSIDNIKVTNGAVEIGASSGGSAPAVGGTTISSGSLNSFSDTADITYTKAADVTAGLGLFAGADGKFMPKANVTRAQMATIIVKMLHGSDANADSFKGTGKFSDVATFEGGWAEGYVNWCATLGIVSGYGDGTFRPGSNVTTAEAATMILNALKVDAGAGQWPHTVMAKAEELDMFQELSPKPANDKALSREELAVMALVGLEYSPEGKQSYEYNGVTYDSFMDAYMVAGPANAGKIEPTAGDCLAGKVFEMQTFEGYIVSNDATDPTLDGVTIVRKQVDGVNVDKAFYITTGLEHVGHFVTVYYSETYTSERDPGLTYTIYDETKAFVVDEAITTSKEYKAIFDTSYRPANDGVAIFNGSYVFTGVDTDGELTGYKAGSTAKLGTYFIHDGAIVAYMDPVTVHAAKVLGINTTQGYETIELSSKKAPISNSEDDDRIVEYKNIAVDDYVTYSVVGEAGIYVLTKTSPVTGTVSKIGTDKKGNTVITVKGQQYTAFDFTNSTIGTDDLKRETPSDFTATYTFYVTADGKYVGYETNNGSIDVTNTVFILGEVKTVSRDSYGKMVQTTYARGVDMDGKEVMIPVRVQSGTKSGDTFTPDGAIDLYDGVSATPKADAPVIAAKKFYSVELSKDKEAKKENLSVLTAISATYDKEEAPVYQHYTTSSDGYSIGYNGLSVASRATYSQSSSVFLTMTGVDVNQTEPLTATVKKGSATTITNPAKDTVHLYYLLSRDNNGTQMIEARVVLLDEDAAAVSAGEGVYIAANWEETEGRGVEGYSYTVYDYKTGSAKSVTLAKKVDEYDAFVGAGFYKLVSVEGESYKDIFARVPDSKNTSVSNTKEGNEDGFASENFFHDQLVREATGNYMSTMALSAFGTYGSAVIDREGKPAGAIVIDLRSEEDIVADGVGKIDSIDRIVNLQSRDDQIVIPVDICYSTSGSKVLTVFVKDVYYNTKVSGFEMSVEGGKTYVNGYTVAANCVLENLSEAPIYDLSDIDDLLNPVAAGPGYPTPEPWTLDVVYEVANGQISSITVNKAFEPGVIMMDNFNSYPVGKFDHATVAKNGYADIVAMDVGKEKTLIPKAASIKKDGGDHYLSIEAGRYYLKLGAPTGPYSVEFDFNRADSNQNGTVDLWIGNPNNSNEANDTLRLRIYRENNTMFLTDTSGESTVNTWLKEDNTISTGTTNAVQMGIGEWWHIKVQVNPAIGDVTVSANQRGSDVVYSGSINKGPLVNAANTINLDVTASREGVGSTVQYIDNIVYKTVSTHQYPVDVADMANGAVTTRVSKAMQGATVTVNVAPNAGYATKAVIATNADGSKQAVTKVSDNEYTFTMGAHPVEVSAEFEPVYNVTLNDVTNGSASLSTNSGVAGTEVTVTTAENTVGYVLDKIMVDGKDITDEGKFTITGNHTVTVTFKLDENKRAVTKVVGDGGQVELSADEASVGTEVTITATPNQHFAVKSVVVTETAGGDEVYKADSGNIHTFHMPAAAVTVTVTFYDTRIVLVDDFESYTAGDFKTNQAAKNNGWSVTGSGASAIVEESGNKVLQMTAQRPNITAGTPTGAYTLKFDFRRDAESSGLLHLWIASRVETNKTYRFVVAENGAFAIIDNNGDKNYYAQKDNTFRTTGSALYQGDRTNPNNKLLEKDVWYRVELTVGVGAKTIGLKVSEKSNSQNVVFDGVLDTPLTLTARAVTFDPQNMAGGNPAMSIDNVDLRLN